MQDSTLIHVSRFVDSAMNEKQGHDIFWYTVESVITT